MIRMRGLPFRASQDDIRAFFRSELHNPNPQLKILDISIEMGPDGRPNGEALVEFASDAEGETAMQFDRQMLGHRYVELRRAWRNSIDPASVVPRPTTSEGSRDGASDSSSRRDCVCV